LFSITETSLNSRSKRYSPTPLPMDLLTSFLTEHRQKWLKLVIPEVVKYFRLPRPASLVLDDLGIYFLFLCE
jgi:hypothetical protein